MMVLCGVCVFYSGVYVACIHTNDKHTHIMSSSQPPSPSPTTDAAPLAAAVAQRIDQPTFDLLTVDQHAALLHALMSACARHPVDTVRTAARMTLTTLHITAAHLMPLLAPLAGAGGAEGAPHLGGPPLQARGKKKRGVQVVQAGGEGAGKKSTATGKKSTATGTAGGGAVATTPTTTTAPATTDDAGVAMAVDTLELLQWREGIHGVDMLIEPLQCVIQSHVQELQQQQALTMYVCV